MTTQTYTVTGMTCGHCAASVTEEISELAGVENVDVVVDTGAVTVTSSRAPRRVGRPRRRRGSRLRAGMNAPVSTPLRVVAFVAALAAAFAVAWGGGRLVGPIDTEPVAPTRARRTTVTTQAAARARRARTCRAALG